MLIETQKTQMGRPSWEPGASIRNAVAIRML